MHSPKQLLLFCFNVMYCISDVTVYSLSHLLADKHGTCVVLTPNKHVKAARVCITVLIVHNICVAVSSPEVHSILQKNISYTRARNVNVSCA